MTSRHFEKLNRLMEMSVGETVKKNRAYLKIVELVRPPENVEGS